MKAARRNLSARSPGLRVALALGLAGLASAQAGLVPQVVQTNLAVTVMAANLTGQSQRYGEPQIRLLQGLRPDIVALQEFCYSNSTPGQIRAFVDTAFGSNYWYFRESSQSEVYDIPNGIVSRFPIAEAGSWDDVVMPNRGFAWARIQLPGSNELYVVSVHFKASGGLTNQARRASEAANLKALIEANLPADAPVVVAGDLNVGSPAEAALATMKLFLSDEPVPADAVTGGNDNTNLDRDERYDYVLPSFSLTNRLALVELGGQLFPNGLVFDSRVFAPLEAVAPVLADDSSLCQHMGVVKALRFTCTVTNWVTLDPPRLGIGSNTIRWASFSNLVFCVETNGNLADRGAWQPALRLTAPGTNYSFAFTNARGGPLFYRVRCE